MVRKVSEELFISDDRITFKVLGNVRIRDWDVHVKYLSHKVFPIAVISDIRDEPELEAMMDVVN